MARSVDDRLPVTRPRGGPHFVLPLVLAAVAGLGTGLDPRTAAVVAAAAGSATVLLLRVEWAALVLVGAAVFEDWLELVSPWAVEWLAAVLVSAWCVRRAHGPLHGHRLRWAALPALVLVAVVVAAYAVHPHGAPGLAAAARYAGAAVVFLVLADCLCGPLAPRRAARWYVVSCVAASVCGLVAAVVTEQPRVAAPVGSAETLAFFLVAALPLVGTVRSSADQPVWWVWASLAVLLVAGAATRSRPGLVALVVVLVVAVVTGRVALRHVGAVLAVLVSAVALAIAVQPEPVGEVLSEPQRYSETGFGARNDVRAVAWELTASAPVLGLGPGAFALFHEDAVSPGELDDPDVDTAYSTVLETSADLGLLGATALYAVWVVPLVGAHRRWRRDRSGLAGGVLLALDGLLAASLVQSQAFALPVWFLAAAALALSRGRRPHAAPFPGSLGTIGARRTSGQPGARS